VCGVAGDVHATHWPQLLQCQGFSSRIAQKHCSSIAQGPTVTVNDFVFERTALDWARARLTVSVVHDQADGCETSVTINIDGAVLYCDAAQDWDLSECALET
jgi:hypothetical protein